MEVAQDSVEESVEVQDSEVDPVDSVVDQEDSVVDPLVDSEVEDQDSEVVQDSVEVDLVDKLLFKNTFTFMFHHQIMKKFMFKDKFQ